MSCRGRGLVGVEGLDDRGCGDPEFLRHYLAESLGLAPCGDDVVASTQHGNFAVTQFFEMLDRGADPKSVFRRKVWCLYFLAGAIDGDKRHVDL